MTHANVNRIFWCVLAALTPVVAAGCSSHTDAAQVPQGVKVGAPLTPSQIQAANQVAANRHAKQNNQ